MTSNDKGYGSTRPWNVYLRGRLIDTVWCDRRDDAREVRKSLIEHDGYHPAIVVRLR